ncbi:uncharacterized protein FA14DRAFT_160035 [Meira miltonrushii]|uniref:Mid2 domain-containing protein n=1 Tax=Meira miltonrushii TaxID=1280837 RepID=A0A316VMI7_9BASI|nr:uncharacterized protein FA14DRAFT_160035 [Meira miltonrushii]PWN38520.1 hypothetical protein FA14DRAFT_160035 [Meira miltonrushii]
MTEHMNSYRILRRAPNDNAPKNDSNSSQVSNSQSQQATSSTSQHQNSTTQSQQATSSTSQHQNSTTAAPSKSTSESHSNSEQASQPSTASPSNSTSPSNNNKNNGGSSSNQGQNNATQAQTQSTPSASTHAVSNSTSPQPNSTNTTAASNTSIADASQSASRSNSTAAVNASTPSNNSQITIPNTSGSQFSPFSTSVTGGQFGNIGSGSQEDHHSSGSISPATIAGIAIGGVAALILVVLCVLFCYRKRKNQNEVMDYEDFEKQKSLHRLSKESLRFKRLSGSSSIVFDTSSRRSSAPRLDVRMLQHHVSMESEEDRAASAGLSGLERLERRSRSLVDFSDQVHIHREPVNGPDDQRTEDERMEFFFINEGAPELTELVRRWSSSSIAPSHRTSNSLPGLALHKIVTNSGEQSPHEERHEGPFEAATNRSSVIHLTEPSKETRNFSRNSILSNLSA